MDFFDLLPDPLLLSILSFLPLPDAARTSILSRRWAQQWADHWADITNLGLDLNLDLLFPQNPHKQAQLLNAIIFSPHLQIRKIQIVGLSDFSPQKEPKDPRNPAQWAHELFKKGVNELSLINRGYNFIAPRCLLSSESLTVLKLQFCTFMPGNTCIVSCMNLRNLELDSVQISEYTVAEIVWRCKKLEVLSLSYCDQTRLKFYSGSLVKLRLVQEIHICHEIVVNAPKLEVLDLQVDTPWLSLYVPTVRECNFWFHRLRRDINEMSLALEVTEVVTGIGSSEYLRLGGGMFQMMSMYTSSWESVISFVTLKKLSITLCTTDRSQTSALNAFLRSCPQLQKLRFEIGEFGFPDTDSSVSGEPFYCPSQHLHEVELRNFTGTKYEMNVLKFIQTKGGVFNSKPEERVAKKSETDHLCNGMAFLKNYARDLAIDRQNHMVSFKLGGCRVKILVHFNVDHLGDLLVFD